MHVCTCSGSVSSIVTAKKGEIVSVQTRIEDLMRCRAMRSWTDSCVGAYTHINCCMAGQSASARRAGWAATRARTGKESKRIDRKRRTRGPDVVDDSWPQGKTLQSVLEYRMWADRFFTSKKAKSSALACSCAVAARDFPRACVEDLLRCGCGPALASGVSAALHGFGSQWVGWRARNARALGLDIWSKRRRRALTTIDD